MSACRALSHWLRFDHHMRNRFLAGLLLAPLFSGCLGILGAERPNLSISLQSHVSLPSSTIFQVVVEGRRYELRPGSGQGARSSITVRAPRTGELDVVVLLIDPAGRVLAETAFRQRFEADSNHWVFAMISERRPLGHCIGELIPVPIHPPLSVARSDSAFIMYGRLPEGAVC